MIDIASIGPHICIPIGADDFAMIEHADAGEAQAQADLGVLFLAHGQSESAIYWLELSAKQNCANGMYLLGRCYIDGEVVSADENLGVMWIAKAASMNHTISKALMNSILAGRKS